MSIELVRASERQSQNILGSPFSQSQASYTSFSEYPIVKKSVLEISMEALSESEQQSQNLIDTQFHNNSKINFDAHLFQKIDCTEYEKHD